MTSLKKAQDSRDTTLTYINKKHFPPRISTLAQDSLFTQVFNIHV